MKRTMLVFILAVILLITACGPAGKGEKIDAKTEGNTFTTSDNVNIAYTYYPADSEKGVILLHMLGRDRHIWDDFAAHLQSTGYDVLSIDLRGHGGSSGDYNLFSADDFNKMVLDVGAAKKFLLEQNPSVSTIYLIGASIGANVALNYASSDEDIKKIVLLSPGLDYRGVLTNESIKSYTGSILIIASNEDSYSAESSKILSEESQASAKLIVYDNAGHGTNMFSKEDSLDDEIISWLADKQ